MSDPKDNEKLPKKGDGDEEDQDPKTGLDKAKLSESFRALFEGLELSEEFQNQATTIFMAAIHEQKEIVTAKLTKSLKEESDAALAEHISELSEKVDNYVTHGVRTYMDENKLAIDEGMRAEAAEAILESAKTITESYGIGLDESEIDAVALAESKTSEAQTTLDEAIVREVALNGQVKALNAKIVVNKLAEGMILTDADRLQTMAESVDFEDAESFTTAVQTLKESITAGPAKVAVNLDEGTKVVITPKAAANLDENVNVAKVKTSRRF